MKYQHQKLADGAWFKLSFGQQMLNIGSEVSRAIRWKNKGNTDYSRMAFFRALELLHFSKMDQKNKDRLKELCRLYEVLGDYFVGENTYKSSDEKWEHYFLGFSSSRARPC